MPRKISELQSYDEDHALNVVVESPRDSRLKIAYDAKRRVFTVDRPLPLGLSFPSTSALCRAREHPTATRWPR
jgi:inorganic pyrophosphatase